MRKLKHTLLLILVILTLQSYSQKTHYFPPIIGNTWDTISPKDLNWCTDSINSLYTFLNDIETKSFIILKDGKIVLEKYFGTYTEDSLYFWFSAGKSLRATLVGKAKEEGLLNLTDKTSDHLGKGWSGLASTKEDLITIWHQITMTTGLDETKFSCVTPSCLNYVADAGTRWAYHNGPYNLTKDIIEKITGKTLNVYTNTSIEIPIGMKGFWLDYLGNSTYTSRARDMARFGLLVLNKGVWDTDTVLRDTTYLRQMGTSSQNLNPSYGFLWWLNGQHSYVGTSSPVLINQHISPNAPPDVYTAAGSKGQFISISPSNGLIMIRQGLSSTINYTEFDMHDQLWKRIMNLNCLNTFVSKMDKDQKIKIYPNPTTNLLKVETNKIKSTINIKVFSIEGSLLKEADANSVSLESFRNGLYFVKVTQNGTIQNFKVIKE